MFDHQFNFSRLLNEPDHFLNAPKHLKDNKAFIEQCTQESTGDFFVYVNEKFKQDENFVFNCASLYATPQYLKAYKGYTFCHSLLGKTSFFSIPRKFRYLDHDIALAIAYSGHNLDFFSPQFAFNNTSAYFFNTYYSYNYEHLNPKQQANPYVAFATMLGTFPLDFSEQTQLFNNEIFCQLYVLFNAKNFTKIPQKFQKSPKFIKKVLAKNSDIFQFLPNKFRCKNKYIRLAFNAKIEMPAKHIGANRRMIFFEKLQEKGDFIFYAPQKFHTTKNLYKAAKLGISSISNYQGKMNDEIARKLVEINPKYFYFLDQKFQCNDLIIRTALYKCPSILSTLHPELQHYPKYLKIALQNKGALFTQISTQFKTRTLLEIALKSDGNVYLDLEEQYKQDKKLAFIAVKQCPDMFSALPDQFQNNKEIIWAALKGNPNIYKNLALKYQKNLEICEYIYTQLPRIIEFMPKKCLTNQAKIFQAIQKDPDIWQYLPKKIQQDHEIKNYCLNHSAKSVVEQLTIDSSYANLEWVLYKMQHLEIYPDLPLFLREDARISLLAIQQDFDNIYHLPVALMKNESFMEKIYQLFRKKCKQEWRYFKLSCDFLIQQ